MKSKRRRFAVLLLKLACAIGLLELCSFLLLFFVANERNPVRSETHLFDAHRNHRLNPRFPGHSADGFRSDKSVSRKKPPKTIRIIALGTSALYGIGANDPYPVHRSLTNEETITHYLQVSLNRRLEADKSEYRVEVINAAVSAHRTYHHLIAMNANLIDYDSDIVINVDGHNDFYRDRPDDPWNQYGYSTSILVDEFNQRTLFLPAFTFTRSLAEYSFTFNLAERVGRRLWYGKVEQPLDSVPVKAVEAAGDFETGVNAVARRQYLLDLWQIHQLGNYAGFDHYVFLQPEVVFEPDGKITEGDKRIKAITTDLAPEKTDKMRKIRSLLPGLFRKRKIPFFDVAELSSHNPDGNDLYLDYCHLTPAGAKITAEQIAAHLYAKVQARIAARDNSGVAAK